VTAGPLAGIRVLDFSHVVTGPFATCQLADFGAEVIKVESSTAVEPGRRLGPFRPDGPRDPDGSALFANLNRNKRSVAINLKSAEGVEIALRLAEKSDVLVENFSVGTMERLGLGPQVVLARNPRIVYLSMSGLGYYGPRAGWVSFNVVIQALSGLMMATGRPGDEPVAVSNSLADFVAGLHGALVTAAALTMRGERAGCWIDLSQYEANVLPAGHLTMAAARGADGDERLGNRSRARAPQGCYRCAGDDAWCVISIADDAEWARLAALTGDPDLADARYGDPAIRAVNADSIDRRIEAWTRRSDARSVERALVDAGISAAAVRAGREIVDEISHLVPSYRTMRHAVVGEMPVIPNPIHFDDERAPLVHPGPRLGEHTDEVLEQVLSVDARTLRRLRTDGVLV
jgi:crotonobetainyl-CoA:carnitine CoA-transferase CaiB-like acyl-CoA transferase